MLGLGITIAVVLTAGAVYGMMGLTPSRQGTYAGGMMGNSAYGGGMMGGGSARPGGMMGASGNMMGGYGAMAQCSQQMASYQNRLSNGSAGGGFVAIVNNAFYPADLVISKGTTVRWVNMDFVQHTVTSGSEQAPTNLFDSHELGHMQGFSYTFNTPGTCIYYCDLHPGMIGTIVVTG